MLRILLEIGLICYRLLNVGRDPVAGVAAFRRSRNIQWDKCPGDVAPSSPTPVPRTTDSSNKWSESARNRTAFHANLPFSNNKLNGRRSALARSAATMGTARAVHPRRRVSCPLRVRAPFPR
jgi:hypothetical protein